MTIYNYLREQLTDIVDSYEKYLKPTYGIAIAFTIGSFLVAALLLHYNQFGNDVYQKNDSLPSYFFYSYAIGQVYSITDLIKVVFVFFVSIFSICMARIQTQTAMITGEQTNILSDVELGETESNKAVTITLQDFVSNIGLNDTATLFGCLIVACILDYTLFQLANLTILGSLGSSLSSYIKNLIFECKAYLPLIIFAFTVYYITYAGKIKITAKRVVLLYMSLWLVTKFFFILFIWLRTYVFALLGTPFTDPNMYFYLESFLGIPLIAFVFLAYYSALTTSLLLTQDR